MNIDDLFLLKDINYSLRNSYLVLKAYEKYSKGNKNIDFQLKQYQKYINLTSSLIKQENSKIANLNFFERNLLDLKFLLCSIFRLDKYFYISLLEENISKGMRRVILSDGSYKEASKDIKLLTRYYLSIETRLLLDIRKSKK